MDNLNKNINDAFEIISVVYKNGLKQARRERRARDKEHMERTKAKEMGDD